jgi:DNA-directed RNA polymerase specialized sigma24 family protein
LTGDRSLQPLLEQLLHDEWGRLLALLVTRFRRLDLAEDGLGEAFEAAIRVWPTAGVPDNPPAWLLTTARRTILDRIRAEGVAARKFPLLVVDADRNAEAGRVMADAGETLVDERLRLVLLCAHPTLSPEAAAALTLRLVLGVKTEDIPGCSCCSPPPCRLGSPGPGRRSPANVSPSRPVTNWSSGSAWSARSPIWRSPPGTHPAPAPTYCGPSCPVRRSG